MAKRTLSLTFCLYRFPHAWAAPPPIQWALRPTPSPTRDPFPQQYPGLLPVRLVIVTICLPHNQPPPSSTGSFMPGWFLLFNGHFVPPKALLERRDSRHSLHFGPARTRELGGRLARSCDAVRPTAGVEGEAVARFLLRL